MKTTDTARLLFTSTEAGDWDKAAGTMTDDMRFSGAAPEPLHKQEYIDLLRALVWAMPDWKFNTGEFKEKGDRVIVPIHITGTHKRDLRLPKMNVPLVPPTGRHVALPNETVTLTFRGDKIASIEVSKVPGGGVMGILQQLGVMEPAHSGTMHQTQHNAR